MSDEVEEKHEPEKPKKEKKPMGPLSLPMIIGLAVGVILLVIASVIVGIVVASKFFAPHTEEAADAEGTKKAKTEKHAPKEDPYAEGESYLARLEGVVYMETGRITTNPKGQSAMFVVVNLGLEFKLMDAENEGLAEMMDKEGKLNMESPITKKLMARIRGSINELLASYTEADLQTNRPKIPELIKQQLKPIFRDFELTLGNVTIQEFIIQ